MAASEDRAQNLLDHFRLTDNHAAELVDHDTAGLTELRQVFADAIL
jgi:hypothetical protein